MRASPRLFAPGLMLRTIAWVTSTIHVLVVTPVIFCSMKLRALRRGRLTTSRMSSIEG